MSSKSPVFGLQSRVLLVGPAGCGKSERLLKIFEERLAVEDPLNPQSYFIVPSREHVERVIKLLVTHGSAGFFSNRVTTLDDLIETTFDVPNPPAISNLSRIALVRRLLGEECGAYFESVRTKPGFLNLVLDFISELKESCWSAAAFRGEMNRLKSLEKDAALKYEALAAIYERYNAALQELGLRDRRDTLALFRAQGQKGGIRFHTLCLDGFFDFTPLQMESVKEFAACTERFSAALTWDAAHAAVFEPVTQTKKLFEALGFEVQMPGKDLPRFQNTSLEHLSRHLFASSEKTKPVKAQGMEWLDAPDPETEAEMIARSIVAWTRDGFPDGQSCRPGNIAVLLRSVRQHRRIFESVFQRFNIPTEIHERERLSENEWIQTTARLVRVFRDHWKKEDWIGFLRSSFVARFGKDARDERLLHGLESWAWKKGLRAGLENWQKAFAVPSPDPQWVSFKSWFDFFVQIETEWRAAASTAEWTRIFKRLVHRDFGMLEFLKTFPSAQTSREPAAPGRFEKILEEMERAGERSASKPQTFEDFADDFLRLVELDLFSLPHLNQNAVQIYDVSLARQKEYDIVFLAGLSEKQFPIQIREDALLSDWERRLLQPQPYGLPERKARQQLEKYLFYLAVTRSRRHLCLSHARRDEEGKPVLPSFYLEELEALFEKKSLDKTVKKDSQPYPALNEVLTFSDLEKATTGILFNPWEPPPEDENAFAVFLRETWHSPEKRSRFHKALTVPEARLADKRILEKSAFNLKAPSPTRLEAYGQCAYRYFANKILKLQESEEDTRVRTQGTIMHGVLEDFFKGPWKTVAESDLDSWLDQALEQRMLENPLDLGPHQTSLSKLDMKNMLARFVRFEIERLRESSFQPLHCEYEIPKDKPVTIEGEGITLNLQGKIDRVDVDLENKQVIISDYKRSRNFKRDALDEGIALQLPLYLLAVQKLLGLTPAGGQLLNVKEGKASGFYTEQGQTKKPLSEKDFDDILKRAMRFSRRYLDELAAGRIAVQPRECMKGCGYASVCRIEKWRLPEIQDQIRRQDHDLGF